MAVSPAVKNIKSIRTVTLVGTLKSCGTIKPAELIKSCQGCQNFKVVRVFNPVRISDPRSVKNARFVFTLEIFKVLSLLKQATRVKSVIVMRFSVSLSVPLPSGLTATSTHYNVRYGVQFIISVYILRQPLDSLSFYSGSPFVQEEIGFRLWRVIRVARRSV